MKKSVTRVWKRVLYTALAAVAVLAICAPFMAGCSSMYSEEKHIERVSKRVEKRYMGENSPYTDLTVYPLYDENDKLGYFVVEFEPYGYEYIKINKYADVGCNLFCMYTKSTTGTTPNLWRRWKTDAEVENGQNWQYNKRYSEGWVETDESGEIIEYRDSHFKVADIRDEKRHLLKVNQDGHSEYIPAVRRGEKWLNLVSMEEEIYDFSVEYESCVFAYGLPGFLSHKSPFNL